MRIFVDTSAFFALLDRDDANHKKAKGAWNNVLNSENILVTTNYILVESFALIQHRLGMEAVRGLHRRCHSSHSTNNVTQTFSPAGWVVARSPTD